MELLVIGTGSQGNCYQLKASNGESIIIDAGVKFNKVKQALNFDLKGVKCLIQTHFHLDHFQATYDFLQAGIDVYTNESTIKNKGLESYHNVHQTNHKDRLKIGDFDILVLDAVHDVPCSMYLINHPESGKIVFMTDSIYSPYTFKGVNQFIIEANYSEEIIEQKEAYMPFLRDRVIKSHQSLEQCIETLKANDLSAVNNIVLIHLSDSNSNEADFKKKVELATLRNVIVARNGTKIDFNINPF